MPTFEQTPRFIRDVKRLDSQSMQRFREIVLKQFVPDVDEGLFRSSLRVKQVLSAGKGAVVYEMTWAKDGRATFQYGEEIHKGVPHVVWRRVGTHSDLGLNRDRFNG